MKAVDIDWDVDNEEDRASLPTEIDIPAGMEDEDDYEEADDLDIAKDELEEEEAEEDEDEDEKLMASLASNRILKRILTAKRR